MKILLTGSASHLAQPLLPMLCAEPRISQIVGIDLRTSDFSHAKYRHHQLDIRDSELASLMPGIDAVIHLAFVVMPGNLHQQRTNRALIRDINVRGSAAVFNAACDAGVTTLIHLSSAAVYGAWPDNPPQMDEQQPLRAMPGFSYAEDKVAVEMLLDQIELRDNAPRIVRLRPHVILGAHAQPLLLTLLRQPFYPRLPEPQPLTQCVWEEDVCSAIELALFSSCRGAFNLAADPPLPFRDMLRFQRRWTLALPFALARAIHRGLWKITGAVGDPAWSEGMRYHLAVDSHKARTQLGWQPQKESEDCLRAARHWR